MIGRPIEWFFLLALWFYQKAVSPFLPPSCRFYPSCSAYAVESIRKHGPVVGVWRSMQRVARCHPYHPGGYDPP